MKIAFFVFFCVLSNLFFLQIDKPTKFEGLYEDTLSIKRIAFVLKYDSKIKTYTGAIMDRFTKQTYAVSIDYATNDSIVGSSYALNGMNKKIVGHFIQPNFLRLNIISESFGVFTESYFLKRISSKPEYDRSKLNENKYFLDKNLVGKWIKLDSLNHLDKDYYVAYNADGSYKNSKINLNADAQQLINEGKMSQKWATQNNVLITYIEASFPVSFDSYRYLPYKIKGDTLFLFFSKKTPSKFFKSYDK